MVGLLLMVRINYQHRLLMNKRRIPALDDYLDRLSLQLWPRLKVPPGPGHPSVSWPATQSQLSAEV